MPRDVLEVLDEIDRLLAEVRLTLQRAARQDAALKEKGDHDDAG